MHDQVRPGTAKVAARIKQIANTAILRQITEVIEKAGLSVAHQAKAGIVGKTECRTEFQLRSQWDIQCCQGVGGTNNRTVIAGTDGIGIYQQHAFQLVIQTIPDGEHGLCMTVDQRRFARILRVRRRCRSGNDQAGEYAQFHVKTLS